MLEVAYLNTFDQIISEYPLLYTTSKYLINHIMSITLENITGINYSSIATAGSEYRSLNSDTSEIGIALDHALGLSETRAYRLTRGILSTAVTEEVYTAEAAGLIDWSKDGTSQQRQLVARSLRNDGGHNGNLYMVHAISDMTRTQARDYMKDYLEAGGSTQAVTDWLSVAGNVLRKSQNKTPGTAGFVVDGAEWLIDQIEDGVDAIVEAIESVVDAILNAGKTLLELVEEVISWTIEQVGDLVEALLEVGQSVADILNAAWDYGIDGLKKFVKAVLEIGKEIGEVLAHAVTLAGEAIQDFVDALITAAVSVGKILEWAAGEVINIGAKIVQSLIDLGKSVGTILYSAFLIGAHIIGDITLALLDIGRTVSELLITAITQPGQLLTEMVRAMSNVGQTIANLFDAVVDQVADGIRKITTALIEIGKTIVEVVAWAIDKAADVIKDVVKAIVDAGKSALDILSDIASRTVDFLTKVVQALFDIGRKVLDLIRDAIVLGLDFARKFFEAITQLAGGLLKFAAEVIKLTYKAAADLVKTFLDAGLSALEILGTVVGAGYFVFRRMVNGLITHLGPVGDILDWALTQAENAVSDVWHDTLLAIRYAEGKLSEAIDWAVTQGDEAFEAILNAWESIEEDLIDFYRAAAASATALANNVFEQIGRATVRLENSVTYVLNYLENDFIPGMRDFIKGLLDAGYELVELAVNIANITGQALAEAVTAILDTGITLTELLAETLKNPQNFRENLLVALNSIDQTMRDVYQSIIIDLGEDYLEEVTRAYRAIGTPVREMLDAVLEISGGALGTVIGVLLSTLGTYRAMTPAEITDARLVFGNTFDYSRIFFAQESLLNDIIFAIQDQGEDDPNSRAFVTNTLVNFDVNDGPITRATMIHELTHVWQFEDQGPFYMAEAVHAQEFGDGYDYGYDDGDNGDGGEDDLLAVFVDNPTLNAAEVFEEFNREQQGDIIMHYFVRRHEEGRPAVDYAPWEPFRNVVFS